jgi:hypothetical protein
VNIPGSQEAELLEQVDRGQHRGSSSRTVAELIERWLSWRQQIRPISPVTVANYRGAIEAMRPHVLVQRVDVEASTCWILARPRFGRSQVLVLTRQNPLDATDEGACRESSRIFFNSGDRSGTTVELDQSGNSAPCTTLPQGLSAISPTSLDDLGRLELLAASTQQQVQAWMLALRGPRLG